MPLCEFVVFDSDKEMVVHFERLERGTVDFAWVVDSLGVPLEEVISALLWPNNLRFTLGLFTEWYTQLAGTIPGAILEEDPSTIPPTVLRRAADIPLPSTGFSKHDDAFAALLTIHIHHVPIQDWVVPRDPMWLPRTPTTDGHLARLVTRGPSRERCVSVRPAEFPHDAVAALAGRIEALEDAIADVSAEVATWTGRRLALESARRVLLLVRWQWASRPRPYAKQEEALARIDELDEAIDALEQEADVAAPSREQERAAARRLMLHLSPASGVATEIAQALEVIAAQPTAFRGEEIDDLFDYLERAFLALSQSSLADEFVEGHVIHLLRALVESLAPELEIAFADAADGDWPELWATDWQKSLDAMSAAGLGETSTLGALAKIGKHYKSASAIILGAINQGTLPVLLIRLAKYAPKPADAHRSFATTLLRGLLATAAAHRGAAGRVLIGGKDMTSWFRACARALRQEPSEEDLREVAKGLRELKLGGAAAKTRIVGSASFVFGAVSTLVTLENAWDRRWQSSAKVVAAMLKTSAEARELSAMLFVQGEARSHVDDVVAAADHLSMVSTVVTFIATMGDTMESWAYLSKANKFARTVAVSSATTALVRLLPFVKASAWWSRVFGVVGVVLAVVDGVLSLAIDLRRADTDSLFEAYSSFALEGQPYTRLSHAAFERVIKAREAVSGAGFFIRLEGPAGERGTVPYGGLPTWHFANGLGFPAEIVAKLFDVDVLDVIAAGMRTSPGFEGMGVEARGDRPCS